MEEENKHRPREPKERQAREGEWLRGEKGSTESRKGGRRDKSHGREEIEMINTGFAFVYKTGSYLQSLSCPLPHLLTHPNGLQPASTAASPGEVPLGTSHWAPAGYSKSPSPKAFPVLSTGGERWVGRHGEGQEFWPRQHNTRATPGSLTLESGYQQGVQ